MLRKISSLISTLIFVAVLHAETIHVPLDYTTIQAGIDATQDGDTVLIADGTYTGEGNYEIDFLGKAIVVISENGPDNCIVNCQQSGRGFKFIFGEDENTVLSGITISNGYKYGGGSSNYWGGGVLIRECMPTIYNCVFVNNSVYAPGYGDSNGGAIYFDEPPYIYISDCSFYGNQADGWGGAICFDVGTSPQIDIEIINSKFVDNSADYGGAIGMTICFDSIFISNCIFAHNSTNSVERMGGALLLNSYGSKNIENSIFYSNTSNWGGAIYSGHGELAITNTIFSANRVLDDESGIISFYEGDSVVVKYCDFYNNFGRLFDGVPSLFTNYLYSNPFFADPSDNNFNLAQYSPCIDAGDPNLLLDPDNTISDMGAGYFDQSEIDTRVDGHCFLNSSPNHEGTKILFYDSITGEIVDSSFTTLGGNYRLYFNEGTYDITYSHFGYDDYTLFNQYCSGSTSLPWITLQVSGIPQNISGQLQGIIEQDTYYVIGDIFVQAQDTAIIEPGCELIFMGEYDFDILGYLSAVGNEEDSIIIRADESITGWGGIDFEPGSSDSSILSFCNISRSISSGISIDGVSPGIYSCTIEDNQAVEGGGMKLNESNSIIASCVIRNNSTFSLLYGGGGAYIDNGHPQLTGCLFQSNCSGEGGGLQNNTIDSNFDIIDCDFVGNYAVNVGAVAFTSSMSEDSCRIVNCNFIDNHAVNTGAVVTHNAGPSAWKIIENCYFEGNYSEETTGALWVEGMTILRNCEFVSNSAPGCGAIYVSGDDVIIEDCLFLENSGSAMKVSGNTDALINNCTFCGNFSVYAGAAIYASFSNTCDAIISSCIFSGNSGPDLIHYQYSDDFMIVYSDFYANQGVNFGGNPDPEIGIINQTNANGDSSDIYFNIFEDPLFVNPAGGDYHLTEGSPCVDAGDPASPLDPDGTVADIGAFYFDQSPPAVADLTITIDDQNVVLHWSEMPDAQSYNVYRSPEPYFDISGMTPMTAVITPEYVDEGAVTGGPYFYVVTYQD